jgi:hypothetical protein
VSTIHAGPLICGAACTILIFGNSPFAMNRINYRHFWSDLQFLISKIGYTNMLTDKNNVGILKKSCWIWLCAIIGVCTLVTFDIDQFTISPGCGRVSVNELN